MYRTIENLGENGSFGQKCSMFRYYFMSIRERKYESKLDQKNSELEKLCNCTWPQFLRSYFIINLKANNFWEPNFS